jgi:dipeptidyl aminopeptidase/acylaminoacyl peptidase
METALRSRKFPRFIAAALLAAAFFAVPPLRADLPPLIPRLAFYGGAEKSNFRVSPDGTRLAYLGPSGKGGPGLWIRTPGKNDDRLVTGNPAALGGFRWAFDNRHLLFLRDSGQGRENFHLFAVDAETGGVRDLTPFEGVKAQNLLLQPRRPDEVLVGLNKRDKRYFDMYRVGLTAGEPVLDTENPGDVRFWLADADLAVRAAVALNQTDASTILRVRETAGGPWRIFKTWGFGETGFLEGYGSEMALAFTPDGSGLYIQACFGGDVPSLVRMNARTGAVEETIAADPKAQIWCLMDQTLYSTPLVLLDPRTGRVQAAAFNYLIPEWKAVDPALQADLDILKKFRSGVFLVSSRDRANDKWTILYFDEAGSNAEALFDRTAKTLKRLSEDQPAAAASKLASTKPVIIKSRDGLDLPSYLMLPVGVEPKNLPLVLLVHGGPWTRDEWGYDAESQWLANRGYAALKVNYRGSAGFGRAFMNAGTGQWRDAMQDDLVDAVRWAVGQGIADPKRIALSGGSFGGYAALAGVTFHPDVYACAIAVCGISNVGSFARTMPDWWAPIKVRWLRRIGPVLEDEAFNERISPLFHTDAVRAKLLIFHGANDPRVAIAESNGIVAQMRKSGVDVTYIVCPDEGHEFSRGPNVLDMMGRMEEFLAKSLGGRAEPWVKIPGSSAQVK